MFEIGEKVTYCTGHGTVEHGMVKGFANDHNVFFVVYHCAGNWDKYRDYTGESTCGEDLLHGWQEAAQGIAKSSAQQQAGQNAPTYLCPECKEQWELAHFAPSVPTV